MGQRVEGGAPPHSRPTLRACLGSPGEPGFLASAGRLLAACLVAGTITLIPTCPCLPSPAPAGSSISLSGHSGDWCLERLSPMSQHHMSEAVTDPCVIYRSICREEVSAPFPQPTSPWTFPHFSSQAPSDHLRCAPPHLVPSILAATWCVPTWPLCPWHPSAGSLSVQMSWGCLTNCHPLCS